MSTGSAENRRGSPRSRLGFGRAPSGGEGASAGRKGEVSHKSDASAARIHPPDGTLTSASRGRSSGSAGSSTTPKTRLAAQELSAKCPACESSQPALALAAAVSLSGATGSASRSHKPSGETTKLSGASATLCNKHTNSLCGHQRGVVRRTAARTDGSSRSAAAATKGEAPEPESSRREMRVSSLRNAAQTASTTLARVSGGIARATIQNELLQGDSMNC